MDIPFLESFVFEKLSATGLPGLSLALVKNGEVVYARGFGQRDVSYGLAATPETLYSVGSVTKSFTALAIMQLAEAGKLELDDPITKYLPYTVKPKGEAICIKHLLSHSTGIPALAYAEAILRHASGVGGKALPIAGPDDIMTFAADAESWVETAPGERWFYFNEGYAMLGQIIEQASGEAYNDYIRAHILDPLGMKRSFYSKTEVEADGDLAVPYTVIPNKDPKPGRYLYRSIRSEGGLISNVLDLSQYIMMYLEGGKGLLSAAGIKEMWEARVAMPWQSNPSLFGDTGNSEPDTHYGYGLSTEQFFGETFVGHGGSVGVATAHMAFLPQSNAGVALLTNGSGYPTGYFAKVALATLLEKDIKALPFLRTETHLIPLTGTYESYKGTMTATVSKNADFLTFEIHDQAAPQKVILVPELLEKDEQNFFTLAGGRRLPVSFYRRNGTVELIFERYKFKRVGP
ncbi:MAG: serine hydrolase [Trueperaceae bacterium]|nr:serine hydrolase [Trueperaceae bacterium]